MSFNYYFLNFLSRRYLSFLLFGSLIFTVHLTFAQAPKTDIKQIVSGIGRYQETMAAERLFTFRQALLCQRRHHLD